MTVWCGRRQRARDEGSLAWPARCQPFVLKLPVGLDQRVRIDRQIAGHILDRGQAISRTQIAQQQRLSYLMDDLQIRRNTGGAVHPEPEHSSFFRDAIIL